MQQARTAWAERVGERATVKHVFETRQETEEDVCDRMFSSRLPD